MNLVRLVAFYTTNKSPSCNIHCIYIPLADYIYGLKTFYESGCEFIRPSKLPISNAYSSGAGAAMEDP